MIETNIRCDNCGNLGISDYGVNRKKTHHLRSELKKLGWSSIEDEDYCPLCQPRRTHPPQTPQSLNSQLLAACIAAREALQYISEWDISIGTHEEIEAAIKAAGGEE